MNELLALAALLWVAGGILGLTGRGARPGRGILAGGCLAGILAVLLALPQATPQVALPFSLAGEGVMFRMSPEALWLFGFGLVPALFACLLGTPAPAGASLWQFGVAVSLLGAFGVCGLQNAGAFLVAWELMSLGGAAMLLSERLGTGPGMSALFMLGLLEVGAVALLLAILLLGAEANGLGFAAMAQAATGLSTGMQVAVGVLLMIGFGAKLGLLPFYEWFPAAYATGSGASGAILSGVVLNAAFLGLSRGLLDWLPNGPGQYALGIMLVLAGVFSAILSILYAFQQEDWRCLLSLSSAENASIAVTTLGASLMFRADAQPALAALAWTVALLHLAGHALAKGAMFLTADGVFRATGAYLIRHASLARRTGWLFSVGALFAAMSLAAMPPQAGFVSEWFAFQTVFQGFHLSGLGGRLVLALAGAGLALTAAVAYATFIKVFGIGILGGVSGPRAAVPRSISAAVGALGSCVLALAAGLPWWLSGLTEAASTLFGTGAPEAMHDGLLLVPLTAKFAFISPTKLVIFMPVLAIVPVVMLLLAARTKPRAAPVWSGGAQRNFSRTATTALTFSNALRTFYSFIYRPSMETTRQSSGREYFITRLAVLHSVTPLFGPYLFEPVVRLVLRIAMATHRLQSGRLNVYLAIIGLLLVVVLALTFV